MAVGKHGEGLVLRLGTARVGVAVARFNPKLPRSAGRIAQQMFLELGVRPRTRNEAGPWAGERGEGIGGMEDGIGA